VTSGSADCDRAPWTGRLSYSLLKTIEASPAEFLYRCSNPIRRTSALRRGTIVHRKVLGDGPEAKPLVVFEGARRGKVWDQFERAYRATTEDIVTRREVEQGEEIATAVLVSPKARPYLDTDQTEVPLEWDFCGIPFRTRGIDLLHSTQDRIGDLKTCRSVDPPRLEANAQWSYWYEQLAIYRDGCRAHGMPIRTAFILAVQSEPPYLIAAIEPPEDVLDEALERARGWAERVKECVSSGHWPGPDDDKPIVPRGRGIPLQGLDELEEAEG
jgi:hypothetical protein